MNLIYTQPAGPVSNGLGDPTLKMFKGENFVHLSRCAGFHPAVVSDLKDGERGFFILRPAPTVFDLFYYQMCGQPRTFFEAVPHYVIEHLRAKRVKLLFYYVEEGDDLSNYGHYFYRALESYNVSPSQVVFVGGSKIVDEKHQMMAKNLGRGPITSIYCPIFQDHASWAYSCMPFGNGSVVQTEDEARRSLRPRLFLTYNRISKVHRLALLSRLCHLDLLHRGLWSHGHVTHDGTDTNLPKVIGYTEGEYGIVVPSIVRKRTVLDTDRFDVNLATSHETQADFGWPYAASHFSIITESSVRSRMDDPSSMLFLTEKTFKTIANLHPFILWGNAHSLQELHRLGYHTFHPWVDESYDAVEDHVVRLELIVNEVHRLSNLSQSAWDEFHGSVWPILQHNRNNLLAAEKQHKKLYETLQSIE